MRFGKTLKESIYSPWKDRYIDYAKLKKMLREDASDDDDILWTEDDEKRFCDELLNVELDKVAQFQAKSVDDLRQRAEAAFEKLKDMTPAESQHKNNVDNVPKGDGCTADRVRELKEELDTITNEVTELKRYSSINYTGFLKIAKKHDRKRGDRYKVRPMLRVSLQQHGFNSEKAYSPVLSKLYLTYYALNQSLDESEQQQRPLDLDNQEEIHNGEHYKAHKFWVHPDNLLEIKTAVLRHLPPIFYSKPFEAGLNSTEDPRITSLYFDNSKFDLYGRKVARQGDASSLRLRWYGHLSAQPDISLEQKTIFENGGSEEQKFLVKDKYVKPFIDGIYKMEKTVQKMERQGLAAEAIASFQRKVSAIQDSIVNKTLEPVLRANYIRHAFQKPSDDRVRIAIDTDVAFVREDSLDRQRPCRDPAGWHRTDIDNTNMTYPFKHVNQSEVVRFPFSILEIKLKGDGSRKQPRWIEDLMASHLVYAVPRFSKFVHGVASLFEDYVNNLPFWLSDLEADIRKDPQRAHNEEEQRKAQRAEEAQIVGGFLGTHAKSASYKPASNSPLGHSYLSERAASDARSLGLKGELPVAKPTDEEEEEEDEEDADASAARRRRNYGTISSVLPSFSFSRYGRAKRQREQLPEGVTKPEVWLKNAGPLQIEPKVWLANERTFLKWQHISILIGSLAISLYTAAGENFLAKCMGIVYVITAGLAGGWGYYMLRQRRTMIMERSGQHFDNMLGPLILSGVLVLALIFNFVFAYRAAFARFDGQFISNGTEGAFIAELV